MTRVVLHRQIQLHLPRHVPAQIQLAQRVGARAQVQDDRARQPVVGRARAVHGFEDVDRVPHPSALAARRRRRYCGPTHVNAIPYAGPCRSVSPIANRWTNAREESKKARNEREEREKPN